MAPRTSFSACILLIAVILGFGDAEAQGLIEGREYPLFPIDQYTRESLKVRGEGIVCGRFIYVENKTTRTIPGQYVHVYFQWVDDKKGIFTYFTGWDYLVVLINNKKSAPTVAFAKKWGLRETPFNWVIEISEKDFKELQACLPKPSKLPY